MAGWGGLETGSRIHREGRFARPMSSVQVMPWHPTRCCFQDGCSRRKAHTALWDVSLVEERLYYIHPRGEQLGCENSLLLRLGALHKQVSFFFLCAYCLVAQFDQPVRVCCGLTFSHPVEVVPGLFPRMKKADCKDNDVCFFTVLCIPIT